MPVKGDYSDRLLGNPLPHEPGIALRDATPCQEKKQIECAREVLEEVEPDLRKLVKALREELTGKVRTQLETDGQKANEEEDERYRSRQGEVSTLIAENTLAKLEREIQQLKTQQQQGQLFESQSLIDELDRSIELKKQELDRRRVHYEEVREQLARERERIVKHLLPKRYALRGSAQVFPVAVEIRLPRPNGGRS